MSQVSPLYLTAHPDYTGNIVQHCACIAMLCCRAALLELLENLSNVLVSREEEPSLEEHSDRSSSKTPDLQLTALWLARHRTERAHTHTQIKKIQEHRDVRWWGKSWVWSFPLGCSPPSDLGKPWSRIRSWNKESKTNMNTVISAAAEGEKHT